MPTTSAILPSLSGWVLRQELTSRGVAVATAVLLLSSAWVSVQLADALGGFFGLCFVLVCLTGALAAGDRALFSAGVLPPLALIAIVVLVALLAPDAVSTSAPTAGLFSRSVAGMLDLAVALVLGHVAALGVVAARVTTRLRDS